MKNLTKEQFDRLVSTVRAALNAGDDVCIANYPERARVFERKAWEVEDFLRKLGDEKPKEHFDAQRC